jgi:hypothetical protein
MRLKNKKTGEICDFKIIADYDDCTSGWRLEKHDGTVLFYDHIDEIHSEWEDAPEEPRGFWSISGDATIEYYDRLNENDRCKEIGNYFDTREEAEKAVEKLKAWKRLKDKGFRFTLTPATGSLDITPGKFQIEINAEMPEKWFCCDAVQKDLDDCFGGEE